jgi:hypothetical protein
MPKYKVIFQQSYVVEADDADIAEDMAFEIFAEAVSTHYLEEIIDITSELTDEEVDIPHLLAED